ncbi:MAG: BatD family protein [Bacteroidota bacterium]
MKNIKWSILVLFIFALGSTYGQDVSLRTSAPKVVALGENFRLSFTANAEPEKFNPPDLDGIMILGGPSTSSQSSVINDNGRIKRQVSISYTYIVRAEKEGNITIPPASIVVEGKTYQSNALEIEVIKGNNAGADGQQSSQQQSNIHTGGEEFLIRLIPGKRKVYVGESIVMSLKLFTKKSIRDIENLEIPPFSGFLKQDVEQTGQVQLVRENIGGEIYHTANYRQFILYPQKAGEITIEPAQMTAILQDFRLYRANVSSKPVTINVSPLPATSKKSFSGGVGKFTVDASVNKTQTVTNDAITLRVSIKGSGNLRLIDDLSIDFPPSIESYDPKVINDLRHTSSGTLGTKTFEYLLIPRLAGNYRIPPIEFTFFNPETEAYQTVSTEEFNFTIEQGEETEGTIITGLSKEDVKFIGEDIQFIKTKNIRLNRINTYFYGSPVYHLSFAVALAVFILLVLIQRKRIKENLDVALVKNRKANKLARKRLNTAQKSLKNNDKEKFYEETLKALWGYLSDKLNISLSDLNHDTAKETFEYRNVPDDVKNGFFELINNCEFARYAPVSGDQQMEKDYEQAVAIITKLDQNLR